MGLSISSSLCLPDTLGPMSSGCLDQGEVLTVLNWPGSYLQPLSPKQMKIRDLYMFAKWVGRNMGKAILPRNILEHLGICSAKSLPGAVGDPSH